MHGGRHLIFRVVILGYQNTMLSAKKYYGINRKK
jgi:hypothetical protein